MKNTIYIFFLLSLAANLFAQTPAIIPIKPDLVLVQGGTFKMLSNDENDEKPVHSVTLSSFSIGKFEVTVGQYSAFCTETGRSMPNEPEWGWQERHPIVNVNYNDAIAYCCWLNKKFGGNWRLPTEDEWEYVARKGYKIIRNHYLDMDTNRIERFESIPDTAPKKINYVGLNEPNELGIYDLIGNVWEWCGYGDYLGIDEISARDKSKDSKLENYGSYRVLRGGSWYSDLAEFRLGTRLKRYPAYIENTIGFRVVHVP